MAFDVFNVGLNEELLITTASLGGLCLFVSNIQYKACRNKWDKRIIQDVFYFQEKCMFVSCAKKKRLKASVVQCHYHISAL